MSNNNPHGHINQTQNSWNPLQIPSYIPRQPQLAHMSNERPMVRSPLAWHAAAPPPDSLYNFMSAANHKNLEHSINPLLPPYVRGPPPFDSMDLSLQSNRSGGSPLNKSTHSLLPSPQIDYGHKLQQAQQQQQHQQQHSLQQQQQMHAPSNYPIHNLSTNSPQSQHSNQTMPSVSAGNTTSTPSSPAQNNTKFLSSNGSDCEQPPSLIQQAQNQTLGANNGNYMRDNFGKMPHLNRPFDNDLHSKSLQKPVELVNKDCNFSNIMPSKMTTPHLQQQHTTKKSSPLRSGNSSNFHVSQTQQPQQSPFNSPATVVKPNGPHTPPTPQSPSIHQSQPQQASNVNNPTQQQQQQQQHQSLLHSGNNNANLLNYNQLHLQQHNNYQQSSLLQHQHLHHVYPPQQSQQQPPPHHHHWQQQHTPQHTQLPLQSPMQRQPFTSPIHPQQQTQQSTHSNFKPSSPATPSYALNTESNLEQRNLEQQHSSPKNRLPQNIPDSAESPITNASSNDDDSNGGNIGVGNKHLPSSPPQQSTSKSKKSNSNSPMSNKNSPQSSRPHANDSPSCDGGQAKSPKSSPIVHHNKSPRKADINSPESLDLTAKNIASPVSVIAASPQLAPTPQRPITTPILTPTTTATLVAEDSTSLSANEVAEKLENGHTPPVITHEILKDPSENDEVETIDKIAEMIAKTTSNSSSQHSHQSNGSNSNDVHSNASSKSPRNEFCESPKTKKQRQAQKLRDAEQNTNDWSTNVYIKSPNTTSVGVISDNIQTKTKTTISSPLVNNDDNAVLAEELRKQLPTHPPPTLSQNKQPLSPLSNSRSSSSSSSSSSCSNSTHSSYGNHAHKPKSESLINEPDLSTATLTKPNVANDDESKAQLNQANQSPLNLNCKSNSVATEGATLLKIAKTPSPDKSKFEEVENKLEEMFAGIEDEPILIEYDKAESELNKPTAGDQIATDLSVALELSNSLKDIPTMVEAPQINQQLLTSTPAIKPTPMPIQTKAAKKSTLPSPIKPITPPSLSAVGTTKASSIDVSDAPVAGLPTSARKTMPRRRLSMALDPGNLRIMFEGNSNPIKKSNEAEQAKDKDVVCILDDERPSTSAAAAVSAALTNTSSDNSNKQTKTRNNNNTNTQSNSKSKNNTTPNSNRSGNAKGNTSGGKLTAKSSAKRTKAPQKRRKQSSSEDEMPTVSGRDANASTTNTATATATEKYKSPFILIKRDGSVSVVNAATAEDSSNDKQTKGKKPPTSYASHERRNIRGFHSSTLSQKYDADTTDSTWICVLCKRGPHRMGLGDLFGPYLVTIDCEEYKNAVNAPDALNIDDEFVNKRRRVEMVQSSPRGPPVVMATVAQEAAVNRMNKKKKKSIDEPPGSTATSVDPLDLTHETFIGMNKVSENSYEVWLHEDCSVWAPDVYLVGARIMGLDAAVWNSTRYQCVLCSKSGATVCCLQRDCKAAAHIPCAREALWSLNESDWHVHCQTHAYNNVHTDENTQKNTNNSNNSNNNPTQKQCTIPSQQTKNS